MNECICTYNVRYELNLGFVLTVFHFGRFFPFHLNFYLTVSVASWLTTVVKLLYAKSFKQTDERL